MPSLRNRRSKFSRRSKPRLSMYASFGSMLILMVSSRLLLAVECKTIGNRRRRDDFQTTRMVTTQNARGKDDSKQPGSGRVPTFLVRTHAPLAHHRVRRKWRNSLVFSNSSLPPLLLSSKTRRSLRLARARSSTASYRLAGYDAMQQRPPVGRSHCFQARPR